MEPRFKSTVSHGNSWLVRVTNLELVILFHPILFQGIAAVGEMEERQLLLEEMEGPNLMNELQNETGNFCTDRLGWTVILQTPTFLNTLLY